MTAAGHLVAACRRRCPSVVAREPSDATILERVAVNGHGPRQPRDKRRRHVPGRGRVSWRAPPLTDPIHGWRTTGGCSSTCGIRMARSRSLGGQSVTCREFADFVGGYLSGELPSDVMAQFERHRSHCANCDTYLAHYRKTI